MKNAIFNTLDIICQIDYNYFILSEIEAGNLVLTDKEKRKCIMGHLRSIIRNKKKLGYDTTADEKTHKEIKSVKVC